MGYGIRPVPGNVETGAIVAHKLTSLVSAGAKHDFDAMLAMREIKTKGLPVHISGVIDLTGSMWDDINFVSTGVAQFLQRHTDALPAQVTNTLGNQFLRVSGATVKVRDIECDQDQSFEMTLFNRVIPETFVDKSTNYTTADTFGGGGNVGESQLLGLLMSLGIPRDNPQIGYIFDRIRNIIVPEHLHRSQGNELTTSPKFDKFTRLYDEYAAYQRKPDMVYLVTDEPPKVQLGVDAAYIRRATQQGKLPKMIFFVRHYIQEWQQVAMDLGAEVFDLERAGDVGKADTTIVVDFMTKSFAQPLLSAIDSALPMLSAPPTA